MSDLPEDDAPAPQPTPRTRPQSTLRSMARRLSKLRNQLHLFGSRIDPSWLTRLTLLYLLVKPLGEWYLRAPMMSLVALGLLVPRLHQKPWLWFAITTVLTVYTSSHWTSIDNHALLLTYWCLALALAHLSRSPAVVLRTSARSLIGLVFLFATLWKVLLSPDYLSGDFLRATLLLDVRFKDFTTLFTDVDPEAAAAARLGIARIVSAAAEPSSVVLPETQRSIRLAMASTYLVALLEAWIAVSFLLGLSHYRGPPPSSRRSSIASFLASSRDAALLLFAVVTYPFATVAGFGWLLMILGLAQSQKENWKIRLAYLFSGWLVLIYREVPWTSLFTNTL